MPNKASKDPTEDDIWYFGYGPIVNPQVRIRKEVKTSQERAAILPQHCITFAFGGVASIVPKRGYEVHGVLMKLENEESWKRLKEDDAGYNAELLDVYPYPEYGSSRQLDHEEEPFEGADAQDKRYETTPVRCYVLVMSNFDESRLEKPIEKKPTERFLRIIEQGMLKYGVDKDYVSDEIMAVPFIPYRPEELWYKFPAASEPLPKITMSKYKKMCNNGRDVYFIICNVVVKLGPHDRDNPGVKWLLERAHGEPDITMYVHRIIVDPRLEFATSEEELTPKHYAWVENHSFEYLQQCGIKAEKVYAIDEVKRDSYKIKWKKHMKKFSIRESTKRKTR